MHCRVRNREWKGCPRIDIFGDFLRLIVSVPFKIHQKNKVGFRVQSSFDLKKQHEKVMNCCLIYVIPLALLQMAAKAEVAKGGCKCGVFDVAGNEPLIEHPLPFEVPCNEEGADKCMQLCLAIAQTAKEKAPAMLCEKLNRHVENLKIALHTKPCDNDWKFTGLESSEAICCHEGKNTSCSITETTN